MITIEDYMEAFEVDELTQTVVLYLESIRTPPFLRVRSARGKKKPVVDAQGGPHPGRGTAPREPHGGARLEHPGFPMPPLTGA